MSRRNATHLEFDALSIEGGLLPAEWLAKVAALEAPHQSTIEYSIPKGLNLRDELGRYWRIATAHWNEFQTARNHTHDSNAVSRRFVVALLKDIFCVGDLTLAVAPQVIDDRAYPVTAFALCDRLPIVIAAHEVPLDARDSRFGDDGRQRSAFGLLQDYLNASDPALWGLASNGLVLRLARDNASLTRPAWIEADLERIFTEERFADFSLLWLLAHVSRFGQPDQLPHESALETWREASREQGTRARDQLRVGVEEALLVLGQGFLARPGNDSLRGRLARGELTPTAYFQQLLRLVYRLIFLLTIEERGLLHPPGSSAIAIELYRNGYSVRRLRDRSRRLRGFDRHNDLWQSLKPVFVSLAQGQDALALPALGGLFAHEQCPDLDTAELGNVALLQAVFRMAWLRVDGSLARLNWRDMGPEELGSVYESLLELVPDISTDGRAFAFASADQSKGNARKTSGSYYTPDALVQELLDSALEPVVAQRLASATNPEAALLAITVCDPACGSGHFLLAAARRLAGHLARLRAQGTPSGEDYRHALREVVTHCIFGVDVNPLALELARMSLWLEAMTPDKPLGFLDHHLQCGDALLGVLDPKILDAGLPDESFAVLSGDDKIVASDLKKRNKAERESWRDSLGSSDLFRSERLSERADEVEHEADNDLSGVAAKQASWHRAEAAAHESRFARMADLFIGSFLLPKTEANEPLVPTSGQLWTIANNEAQDDDARRAEAAARAVCAENLVLHWWVAFPQIADQGGFAVMLGNPPWERIKLQEEEFFAARSPYIASAINKAERSRRIGLLREGRLLQGVEGDDTHESPPSAAEQKLHQSFLEARRNAEAASAFAHAGNSEQPGRYPLTGVGDVNTYALFAETFHQLCMPSGRAGFIVPSGIGTDDSTKRYFQEITQRSRLVSFIGFDNARRIFPAVHADTPFALITIGRTEAPASLRHYVLAIEQLDDPRRAFTLTPDEFALINPNTRTCPVFRCQQDAELTKKLYQKTSVLICDAQLDGRGAVVVPEINSWHIRFSTMFHMSNDSDKFFTKRSEGIATLPLYEAKVIHQFDHRWATYITAPDKKDAVDTIDVGDAQKADSGFTPRPRYWVDEREVLARIARVPRAVAKAWLATHTARDEHQRKIAYDELRLALAQWTAGELFRREAGPAEKGEGYTDAQRLRAGTHVQRDLTARFAGFAQAFGTAGFSSRKFIVDCGKWALQDRDTPLDDVELNRLIDFAAANAQFDYVALRDELDAWMDRRSPRWLIGWRDITNATNERTVIASVIPRAGVGNNLPLMLFGADADVRRVAALLGNLCSLALDFVARHKVGGTHLNYFIYKQLPILPPKRYASADLAFIVPRVLELTYTAHDLSPWAVDLGYTGGPFTWNPDRRAVVRAELDAYYARLYGFNRDELRYILDPADVLGDDYPSETFRVLKNNEIRAFGEYRTQRLVLHEFDRMALADASGVPYQSLLVPAPGVVQEAVYSSQGVVTNPSEAICAGFVLVLIRQSQPSLRREALSQILAYFSISQNALEPVGSEHLHQLLEGFPVMAMTALMPRLQDVLLSLESCGAIRVEQQGAVFRSDPRALTPDWVNIKPSSTELADLLLKQVQAMQQSAPSEHEQHIAGRKGA